MASACTPAALITAAKCSATSRGKSCGNRPGARRALIMASVGCIPNSSTRRSRTRHRSSSAAKRRYAISRIRVNGWRPLINRGRTEIIKIGVFRGDRNGRPSHCRHLGHRGKALDRLFQGVIDKRRNAGLAEQRTQIIFAGSRGNGAAYVEKTGDDFENADALEVARTTAPFTPHRAGQFPRNVVACMLEELPLHVRCRCPDRMGTRLECRRRSPRGWVGHHGDEGAASAHRRPNRTWPCRIVVSTFFVQPR